MWTIVKELLQKLISYLSKEAFKEAMLKALEAFKNTLWENIKDEVHACALEIVEDAKKFLESVEAKEKEEIILNTIMEKINLPVILKPFKGLIKKIIKNKMEDFINKALAKSTEFIG